MLGVTLAIAFFTIGIIALGALAFRQNAAINKIEEIQLKQIASDAESRKETDRKIDNIITIHNATVEHYDNEIDQIIARLNQITEDIARIDRDEKEIRSYYINFRDPAQPNGGVEWAPEYPTQEDDHAEND